MTTDHVGYEDRTMPIVCYALYLLAFATGITAVVGLIIAYVQRSTAGPINQSHYTYLIRTFWITLLLFVGGAVIMGVGAILAIVLIGIPIMAAAWLICAAATILYAIRCIVGLVYLSRGEAHPRAYAVLA
jgi:uncharacterized membrane protein